MGCWRVWGSGNWGRVDMITGVETSRGEESHAGISHSLGPAPTQYQSIIGVI